MKKTHNPDIWAKACIPPCPGGVLMGDPLDMLKQALLDLAFGEYPWTEWIEICYDQAFGNYDEYEPTFASSEVSVLFHRLWVRLQEPVRDQDNTVPRMAPD